MPLGIIDVTEYEQFDVELISGDCVLTYTDALMSLAMRMERCLARLDSCGILRLLGDVEPQLLTKTLLREIKDRFPDNLTEDDGTVLLVRANGHKPRHSFRDILWANIRFAAAR